MAERILIFFLLFFSTLYFYAARKLEFGTILKPMAGFLPSIAGFLAILLLVYLLIANITKKEYLTLPQIKTNWTRFVFICVGLIFFTVIVHFLGYFIATFLLLFYLFKITGASGVFTPCLVSLASATFFYILFVVYLTVPLP